MTSQELPLKVLEGDKAWNHKEPLLLGLKISFQAESKIHLYPMHLLVK